MDNSKDVTKQHSRELTQWARKRIGDGELITMPDFARSFQYCCSSKDADIAFVSLLACSILPQNTRDGALAL